MTGKIKRKLIWSQFFILIAVVGAGALIYYLAAPFYHRYQRNRLLREAYEALMGMDLGMLEDNDATVLWQYEEQRLRFTIANENFEPVYTTWSENMYHQVERDIIKHLDEFSEDPDFVMGEYGKFATAKIMGLLEQEGDIYYVSIRIKVISSATLLRNTEFVLVVFLAAIFLSLPLLYIYAGCMVKPLVKIMEAADHITHQGYNIYLDEEEDYKELIGLARNINLMAGQLQKAKEKQEKEEGQYQEMEHAWEMLEDIRKDVVADISHELKTPLAIISSQVEMLQCMDDRIDRSYYYDSIVEEVSKMSDMVGELMDLSFQEQKLQEMEQSVINLSDIMEYVCLKYQALFAQNHIKDEFSVEKECYVWGNGHYLEQAIDNYIMNAFSHTLQGNSISVCLYRENEWIWVTVYNQGKKIETSDMERIWQGYVVQRSGQNAEEEKLEQKHMGIGLYLVRRIIGLHRGECGVDNVDKGVKFWFKIPVVRKNGEKESDEDGHTGAGDHGSGHGEPLWRA